MYSRGIIAVAAVSMSVLGCTQSNDATDAASTADPLGSATLQASDGTPVRESFFRYYATNVLQKSPEQLTDQEREAILESLANLEALADEAEERGLPNEEPIAVQLELQRLQVLARSMVNRFVEENPPSEEELQAEYQASASEFATTEHKARHILVESEDEAKAVIADLQGGADFAELAQERSTDPSADSNGGDLGWFTSDSMVAPFAAAVSAMEVGTFSSEPVETQFGWHVILLEDRRTSEPPGLDAVRAEITNRVTQRKVEEYLVSLRSVTNER
ncbi:MAG TPA: peptidylprolyl isomerase [Gammaproteobacteria bacterium]